MSFRHDGSRGMRRFAPRVPATMVAKIAAAAAVTLFSAVALFGCQERPAADAKPNSAARAPAADSAEPPPLAEEEHTPPVNKAELIGRTLPPYPRGMAEVQGVCVPGGDEPERICDFGVAILGPENADVALAGGYVVASRNADPAAAQPAWVVTDALDVPAADPGRELQLGGCRLDGKLRNDIVALVLQGNDEYSDDIGWAMRLDIASGKFVDVDLKRVDCQNPGFGV